MTGADPRLAVLVVNYGAHDLVERNLAHLADDEQLTARYVVVDNLASDQDREAMREVCERQGWTFVASPGNGGFGAGNNLAVEVARELGCTEFLFLNPDARIDATDVRGLHERVLADPMLLVAPVVLRPGGALFSAEVDLHLQNGRMLATAKRPAGTDVDRLHTWVSGACFLLGDRLWDATGGFDPSYFLYWEDVDLCHRVVVAGGRVEVDRRWQAVHDEGGTHGFDGPERVKSPLYYHFNTRNRLVYAAKHLARDDRRRWLWATPAASYAIVLQGGRRQFVRPHRSLWPALRGTLAGLRHYRRIRRLTRE